MKNINSITSLSLLLLLTLTPCLAANRGIPIVLDEDSRFEYIEDFTGPELFDYAFLSNLDKGSWNRHKKLIINAGPDRDRMFTYRFYGDRLIEQIDIRVDQTASSHLGGRNMLYLSSDGLNWTLIAGSEKQSTDPNDPNGWQGEPLTISPQQAKDFLSRSELWVRVVLDNTSGKKTDTSNKIDLIDLKLKIADKLSPQAIQSLAWGKLRRRDDFKSITLDWADPLDQRPPHYYEDSDGWLRTAGQNPYLAPDESEGFPVHRIYHTRGFPDRDDSPAKARSPLSLAVFVKTESTNEPLMARIVVASDEKSSQKMSVSWDDKLLATFDTRSYFDRKVFFVDISASQAESIHELRIAGQDRYPVLIKQITIAGSTSLKFAEKPVLAAGGSLEVLGGYYMPDPKPPTGSQTVEGRHTKAERTMGMIFKPMQELYERHAEFGGMRIAFRNSSKVPVRIDHLDLNGKPIEQSYIDFGQNDWSRRGVIENTWDARGVLWYHIRPRLIQPGQCGEVYIRFRRHFEGDRANITIHLENGGPTNASISYNIPPLTIDYATTDAAGDTLYLYARRRPDAEPPKVTKLRLDGEEIKDVKIYGADFPGNVALLVAKLDKPLQTNTYHLIGLQTDTGRVLDAQFRVLPFFFMRSSFYGRQEILKTYNTNFSMGHMPLAEAEKLNFRTMLYDKQLFIAHERTLLIYGPDEPDAHDWKGARKNPDSAIRHARGMGYHARVLSESGWLEIIENKAPRVASILMIDGTNRPMNWYVYGQFADVLATDPYPNYAFHADHTFVRECLGLAQLCAAPKPLVACLEAFDWGYDSDEGRFPIPAEYRYDVVAAIGSGMKGLTSWATSFRGTAGWSSNKDLAQEVKNLNTLIERIDDKLLIGTPIDLATSDAGLTVTGNAAAKKWLKDRVWVGSLLCGPDTLIITATNHIPESNPEPPTVTPAENVTITIKLPDFLPSVEAFEVTENGIVPFDSIAVDGNAVLKLASIESGRVFLLKRK